MATEILIAEDNPKQAELAAAYLRREGHRVTLVGDGPAVFEACRQRRPDLVVLASLERLTPVLMTALSAGIALVPLLYDAASPGKEILHPVAVAIFGGLVSATLLDALLTPVLILRFGRRPLERLMAARDAAPAGAAPADLY